MLKNYQVATQLLAYQVAQFHVVSKRLFTECCLFYHPMWILEREDGGGMDWIDLAQDKDKWRALVNAIMNLWVPQNAGKLSSGYTIGGLSSSGQFHRGI
jgi:hypothetical protein